MNFRWRTVALKAVLVLGLCMPVAFAEIAAQNSALPSEASSRPAEKKRLISLDFQNTPLSTVLEVMTMKTGLKFIADAELARKSIVFVLRDVTPEDALNALLDMYNLYYVRQPNADIYIIKNRAEGGYMKTISKVLPVNYAPVMKIQEVLRSKMSSFGNISADDRSNTIILTDTADVVDKVEQLIKVLDVAPRQVLLEARIVDMKIGSGFQFGINYDNVYRTGAHWINPWKSVIARDSVRDLVNSGQTVNGTIDYDILTDFSPLAVFRQDFAPGGTFGDSTNPRLGLTMTAGDYNVQASIEAVKDDSNAKLLSNPKLLVLDGQEASIDIIDQIPYTQITIANGATTTSVAFKDIGIRLRVKPIINRDKTIVLNIMPEQSFQTGTDVSGAPIVNTSKANTMLMIKDGDTTSIGGLIRDNDSITVKKVPLLGDIPILGYLFKQEKKTKLRSELTIFITAKIVE